MSVEGIVFGLVVLLAIATVEAQSLKYPPTRKSNHVDVYHGTSVPDPYQWLENTESAETKAWIEAQNALTIPYLHSLPHREPLKRILTRRWNYPRYGIPFKRGRRYFYFKNDGLQNQAVLYWQPTLTGKPRVLLDPNLLSPDGTVSVSSVAVSEDGRWLAYGLSQAGSDWQQIKVRSVETGEDLPDDLCWVKFSSIAWTKDGKGFFYCRYPEPPEHASPMWHPICHVPSRDGGAQRVIIDVHTHIGDLRALSNMGRKPIATDDKFQDKLLFGTDVCFADEEGRMPHLRYLKERLANSDISQEVYDKITHKNALKILKRWRGGQEG